MPTPEEIAVIRAKAVSERTEVDKAILQEADHPGTDPKKQENMIPQSRLNEVLAKEKQANERAEAAERAAKEAQDALLKGQNDYKTLYEQEKAQREALAPKAAQVDAYEKTLVELLISQIAEMPEDRRGLVPAVLTTQQKIDWIAANRAILMAPKAFNIGAGQHGGSGGSKQVEITDEEAHWADRMGMTREEYASNKYKE